MFLGVGKTVIATEILNKMSKTGIYIPVVLNFSAQTSSTRTQVPVHFKGYRYDIFLQNFIHCYNRNKPT